MTTPSQPIPARVDEILDELHEYLPDEMYSLNHNDLPETKAAILKLMDDTFAEVIGLDSKEGDEIEDSLIPMGFDQAAYWNTLRAEQRSRWQALKGGEAG